MALASPRIRADVIDAAAFPDAVVRFNVWGVPTAILNDAIVVEGPVPEETFVEFVGHASDPSRPAPCIPSLPFRSCGKLERD